jgi:ribonucleotide monophosphatase NagD (HAD superfamily)
VVAERMGAGARVLPVGGPGVPAALRAAGLTVVERAEDRPQAVVQGYGREVGWVQLAEAVVAVRNGARHVATNTDSTIPSPRGPLPGNGAMVAVVRNVTGQEPLVTGKPDPAMHAECVRRTGAQRPIVVGDRLDTDIEGAARAGAASLLVFTGVTDAATLLAARPDHRPDLISADAAGLLVAHPTVVAVEGGSRCGAWLAGAEGGRLVLRRAGGPETDDDGLAGLRALCVAHWSGHPADGVAPRVVAGDDAAARALAGWGLAD